jgi:predicted transcriptional regulator of viral defense system
MTTKRQVSTEDFFASNPVFSLDQAAKTLEPPSGRTGAVYRLKHHLETGRLKRLARELYAVVPSGKPADGFQPDAFLAAQAARPDGVFSYHSALELLGVAHSVWHQCTVFSDRRRQPLVLDRTKVMFFEHPMPIRRSGDVLFGTQKVERRGQLLRVTGPERTLVEGFHRLDLVGGLAELNESAAGFPALDLDLLESVLERYGTAKLWAATGWFLEQHRDIFHVSDVYLQRLEAHCPRAPLYLMRKRRGGTLVARWNIVLPPESKTQGELDER